MRRIRAEGRTRQRLAAGQRRPASASWPWPTSAGWSGSTIDGVPVGAVLVDEGWPVRADRRARAAASSSSPPTRRSCPASSGASPGEPGSGLARAGSTGGHGSGEIFVAISTAVRIRARERPAGRHDPPSDDGTSTRSSLLSSRRPRRRSSTRCSWPIRSPGAMGTWSRACPWTGRSSCSLQPAGSRDDEAYGERPMSDQPSARVDRLVDLADTLAAALGRPGEHLHDRRPGAGEPAPPRGHRRRPGRPAAGRRCGRPLRRGPGRPARPPGSSCPSSRRWSSTTSAPQALALDVASGAVDLGLESEILHDPDRRAAVEEPGRAGWPRRPSTGSTRTGPPGSSCWP